MRKARTTKMQTGQVDVTFVEFKKDKSNEKEVLSFSDKVKKEGDKLVLLNGQVHPKTKEKLSVSINPGDVVAIYPKSTNVFTGISFFENHVEKHG